MSKNKAKHKKKKEKQAEPADLPLKKKDGADGDNRQAAPIDNNKNEFFELSGDGIGNSFVDVRFRINDKIIDIRRVAKYALVLLPILVIVLLTVVFWPSSTLKVPEIEGRSLDEGMRMARKAGFIPSVAYWKYSDIQPDGVILTQQPQGGIEATRGSKIALGISKGPEPETGLNNGTNPVPNNVESTEKIICVDPGHQVAPGEDEWTNPGQFSKKGVEVSKTGSVEGSEEYNVNLKIGEKLKEVLEKEDITVVMTHESKDIKLSEISRAEIGNNAEALLRVSIHCGYSQDEDKMGSATFYPAQDKWTQDIYERSKTAALFIQKELIKELKTDDLGAISRKDFPGFTWSKVPVVEVDVAYLSNPVEVDQLVDDNFQQQAAMGIRNGILRYLESQ